MIYDWIQRITLVILVPAGLVGIYIAIDRYKQASLIALGCFLFVGLFGFWFWRKREWYGDKLRKDYIILTLWQKMVVFDIKKGKK